MEDHLRPPWWAHEWMNDETALEFFTRMLEEGEWVWRINENENLVIELVGRKP